MLETDSPDLPPEIPGVGKLTENEPGNLIEISKILAAYLNKTDIELIQSSNENVFRFLGIL
jgi:Tat protein secretion system quality control protein TatD with DNase activity